MKAIIQYTHPVQPDGLSIQGHFLYKGMSENGDQVAPCDKQGGHQKEWIYNYLKPQVSIGIGVWNETPNLIHEPQKHNITPVPWFVADGWIANYHDTLNKLPLILTTSEWVKEVYVRDGVSGKNIHPTYIGIDTDETKPIPRTDPKVKKIREMFGIKEDEVLLMTVGGDVTSKGAQEMIRALHKINGEFKNWKYLCKAWPSESAKDHHREEMQLMKELNLDEKKIMFIDGCFSNEFMTYLLNACDIYAAPSRLEGFGMIQVEAQACGKPVISINKMGPKETIVHKKTGFLADVAETIDLEQEWATRSMGFKERFLMKFDEPKTLGYRADVDQLAEYTLKLMQDKDLREKMGKEARKHTVKNFHYTHTSKIVSDLIKKKLNLE
ncbi:glycosyltransferase family 4 protein [Candidatus Woesearchaeota archaeon]|nr:glycosyltransferase family 4 protein [Candidatus Woesearchaeota archaeon]